MIARASSQAPGASSLSHSLPQLTQLLVLCRPRRHARRRARLPQHLPDDSVLGSPGGGGRRGGSLRRRQRRRWRSAGGRCARSHTAGGSGHHSCAGPGGGPADGSSSRANGAASSAPSTGANNRASGGLDGRQHGGERLHLPLGAHQLAGGAGGVHVAALPAGVKPRQTLRRGGIRANP